MYEIFLGKLKETVTWRFFIKTILNHNKINNSPRWAPNLLTTLDNKIIIRIFSSRGSSSGHFLK